MLIKIHNLDPISKTSRVHASANFKSLVEQNDRFHRTSIRFNVSNKRIFNYQVPSVPFPTQSIANIIESNAKKAFEQAKKVAASFGTGTGPFQHNSLFAFHSKFGNER